MRLRSHVIGLVAVLAVSSCASEQLVTEPSVIEFLHHRADSVSRTLRPYRTLSEALPTVPHIGSDQELFFASDLFAVGSVVGAEEGVGFVWDLTGDVEQRTMLEYGDPRAIVSTVHLLVKTELVVGRPDTTVAPGEIIRVGLAVRPGQDVEAAKTEFETLGEVALLLTGSSPVFDYDREVWSVLEDGGLLAVVGPDGIVSMPVLSDAEEKSLLGNEDTVEEILAAAPDEPITLVGTGVAP